MAIMMHSTNPVCIISVIFKVDVDDHNSTMSSYKVCTIEHCNISLVKQSIIIFNFTVKVRIKMQTLFSLLAQTNTCLLVTRMPYGS